MKLLLNALIKFMIGLLVVGILVFLPAGTIHYPNGWLFMGLLFIPMLILGTVLFLKAPKLLEKRLDTKEEESTQKGVVALSGLVFLTGFVIAGLDYRFRWSHMPKGIILLASILFLIGYTLYAEVMRENAYLSRTVKVQENQKVIDTGLYSIVRHPMYMATILLFLALPLVLGSWPSLIIFLAYPIVISVRIKNEEKVLEEGLEGYTEYKKRVKYRIIPFVW